ncbi:MAG: ABC-2 family transporter protein [Tissierellia bacterium]|nr:ABC-2 family transporter protein [Tissierellia bacterium]
MKTINHKLKLILRYLIISYKQKREFKSEFISYISSVALGIVGIFVFWYSLKTSGVRFQGWSFDEILILNGFYFLSKAISTFSFGFRDLEYKIIDGSFDTYMMRPHSPFFMLACERFNLIFLLTNLILSMALIIWGVLQFSTSLFRIIMAFLISLMSSLAIEIFYMSFSLLSFYFGKIYYARELLFSLTDAKKYPLDIFPKGMIQFFTYFMPLIAIATIPTKIMTNSNYGFTNVFSIVAMILLLQILLYKFLKRKVLNIYCGTGN